MLKYQFDCKLYDNKRNKVYKRHLKEDNALTIKLLNLMEIM